MVRRRNVHCTTYSTPKQHEKMVKDFNHATSPTEERPNRRWSTAIERFKHDKKGSRNGRSNEASSLHRGSTDKFSTDKTCSKCSTIHAYRDCPAFGKKCHKCGNKNHFSSWCRSNVSQDKGCQRDRTQTHGRSPERCHQPGRGQCLRSRSCSRSSGESVTRNAHSIEVDRYDIDDIDTCYMCFIPFTGRGWLPARATIPTQTAKLRSSPKSKSSYHTDE